LSSRVSSCRVASLLVESRLFFPSRVCSFRVASVLVESSRFVPTRVSSFRVASLLVESRLFFPSRVCSLRVASVLVESRLFLSSRVCSCRVESILSESRLFLSSRVHSCRVASVLVESSPFFQRRLYFFGSPAFCSSRLCSIRVGSTRFVFYFGRWCCVRLAWTLPTLHAHSTERGCPESWDYGLVGRDAVQFVPPWNWRQTAWKDKHFLFCRFLK
jgi:hypothetical protein